MDREKIIVRTSVIGILANVLLAGFKAFVGFLSNSIAVILDAVNNLSDALSSVITIIGTRMAAKKPDRDHPLGHGRTEYLTALIVSSIVLYAGLTSLSESVRKILHPVTADYTLPMLVILVVAIAVKLVLGRYVKETGRRVHSDALAASGQDALSDALISGSVLAAALFYLATGISLEAYVGVMISLIILRAGYKMMSETLSDIIGRRMDRELVAAVKETICVDPQVHGAYDLILHSYGPEQLMGSVHVEVDDTMTAEEIDLMERRIADRVFRKHGIALTGIGIYSRNTKSGAQRELQQIIREIVMAFDGVLQMHGFYADMEKKEIHLDLILDFEVRDRQALLEKIREALRQEFPEYTLNLTMDLDI